MTRLSAAHEQRVAPTLPELHLSGPRLREALSGLLAACAGQGGLAPYIEALELKGRLIRSALLDGDVATLDLNTAATLFAFMPTVRRRVAPYLQADGFDMLKRALGELLGAEGERASGDQRLQRFVARFPRDRDHRFVRDLAAEVLHGIDPEAYPLVTRWVWDARSNTGVLREIWFGEDADRHSLPIADDFATFLALRQELAVFLSGQGFYRDIPHCVDLLQAHVYAGYIAAQGSSYLRTDFSVPEDPMQYTRRLLGLDGVRAGASRARLKAVDGIACTPDSE